MCLLNVTHLIFWHCMYFWLGSIEAEHLKFLGNQSAGWKRVITGVAICFKVLFVLQHPPELWQLYLVIFPKQLQELLVKKVCNLSISSTLKIACSWTMCVMWLRMVLKVKSVQHETEIMHLTSLSPSSVSNICLIYSLVNFYMRQDKRLVFDNLTLQARITAR
jgi:hypothetical protein